MTARRFNIIERLLVGATLAGLLAFGYAMTQRAPDADAAEAKNLQVLPKDMPKKEIKKIMKVWAKSLGVKCEHCHDMDDMSADTNKHKKEARKMVRMVEAINKKHLAKYKAKVTCQTCHAGKKNPPK